MKAAQSSRNGPSPLSPYPMDGIRRVGFLKPLVSDPLIEIGEYTYFDDPDGPENFVARCVLYHYPHMDERLIIGRFCAIAMRVQFIMSGANHALGGFSTFPFAIFGAGWGDESPDWKHGRRGDTVVGNDVWIGMGATIMPGVRIGDGAIIGAHAVVTREVPPYGVVAGNPAALVKQRFDTPTIERLLAAAWWNWTPEKITRNIAAIRGADIAALESAA